MCLFLFPGVFLGIFYQKVSRPAFFSILFSLLFTYVPLFVLRFFVFFHLVFVLPCVASVAISGIYGSGLAVMILC